MAMRALLGLFMVSCALRLGAAEPMVRDAARDAEEIKECRAHLRMIYQAIQAYRRVHHDLPNDLAELEPEFLASSRYLICPTAQRLGLTSGDLTEWGATAASTYGYEFGNHPIPKIISGGSGRTMREWKRLQMGLIGSDVAMVRCHTHEKAILNLSFGGRLYESEQLDWEQNFEDVIDPLDLSSDRCLSRYLVPKKIVVPRRDPGAPPNLIDLSDNYNLALDEVWPGSSELRPFVSLPKGVAELSGTKFDIRGAVQLGATLPGLITYPRQVADIRIGTRVEAIQLLVGTAHSAPSNAVAAEVVFRFAGGREDRFQLHYGREFTACVLPAAARPLETVRPVWSTVLRDGQTLQLFQCRWINPSPGEVVSSMDFKAGAANAAPILFALSVRSSL